MILTDDKQVEALEEARRLAEDPDQLLGPYAVALRDPPPTYTVTSVQHFPPPPHPPPPPPPPHEHEHEHNHADIINPPRPAYSHLNPHPDAHLHLHHDTLYRHNHQHHHHHHHQYQLEHTLLTPGPPSPPGHPPPHPHPNANPIHNPAQPQIHSLLIPDLHAYPYAPSEAESDMTEGAISPSMTASTRTLIPSLDRDHDREVGMGIGVGRYAMGANVGVGVGMGMGASRYTPQYTTTTGAHTHPHTPTRRIRAESVAVSESADSGITLLASASPTIVPSPSSLRQDEERGGVEGSPVSSNLKKNVTTTAGGGQGKPTNYVSMSKTHSSIHHSLVLDPTLPLPPGLGAAMKGFAGGGGGGGGGEPNLRMESLHGNVSVDVHIVDEAASGSKPVDDESLEGGTSSAGDRLLSEHEEGGVGGRTRAFMVLKSTHGSIVAKIHGSPSRHPFVLKATTSNGDIRLHIPRTFHGPIIIKHKHGAVRFSDAVGENLMTFGDIDGTRRCFLGDFSKWGSSSSSGEGKKRGGGGDVASQSPFSFASLSPTSPTRSATFDSTAPLTSQSRRSNNGSNSNASRSSRNPVRSRTTPGASTGVGSGAGQTWTGDELVVDVRHGNVKIHYDDDALGAVVKSKPSFLNRIFGF